MTLYEIELAVANMYDQRKNVVVPNISHGLFMHECDLLVVTASGYAIEIEIKRTPADLKKDASKHHGHVDKQNRLKCLYFAMPNTMEKYIEYVPAHAGIILCYRMDWVGGGDRVRAKVFREPQKNDNAQKLTEKEINHVNRLAVYRIWSRTEKNIKLSKELAQYKNKSISKKELK